MDSKTADELFGSSDDAGIDFFSQSQNSEPEAEGSWPVDEQQTHTNNHVQEDYQVTQQDPYGQLHASSAVRTPNTARPAVAPAAQRDPYAPQARDPYAPQQNGSYMPASTPSTYTPASHGAQYDPYAAISRSTLAFKCRIFVTY